LLHRHRLQLRALLLLLVLALLVLLLLLLCAFAASTSDMPFWEVHERMNFVDLKKRGRGAPASLQLIGRTGR
jgi:Spy/CpxP family protein refolding chaperone